MANSTGQSRVHPRAAQQQRDQQTMPTVRTGRGRAAVTARSIAVSGPDAPRRLRGRPARISRDEILGTALRILANTHIDDFMIKTVAAELGTGSMAIYNYFASREELLKAAADEVCNRFEAPRPGADWRRTLLSWLWTIKSHADTYPLMPFIIGFQGTRSPGWIRMTAPVTVLMYKELGLRGKSLALATYLFGVAASTMIYAISEHHERGIADTREQLGNVELDAESLQILRQTPLHKLGKDEVLDALFAQFLGSIESLLPEAG